MAIKYADKLEQKSINQTRATKILQYTVGYRDFNIIKLMLAKIDLDTLCPEAMNPKSITKSCIHMCSASELKNNNKRYCGVIRMSYCDNVIDETKFIDAITNTINDILKTLPRVYIIENVHNGMYIDNIGCKCEYPLSIDEKAEQKISGRKYIYVEIARADNKRVTIKHNEFPAIWAKFDNDIDIAWNDLIKRLKTTTLN